MHIIGPEPFPPADDSHVHTIDVWFSERQRSWLVQRLNGSGEPIGAAHKCRSRPEAMACLADWMRRHPETHLTSPVSRAKSRSKSRQ